MVSKLELILKELNDSGKFHISSFSTTNGLTVAYHKTMQSINENTFTAMSALLLESANVMREELALSDFKTVIIKYRAHYFLIRAIKIDEEKYFILSILAPAPVSKEMEYYYEKLIEWGVNASIEELNKLTLI